MTYLKVKSLAVANRPAGRGVKKSRGHPLDDRGKKNTGERSGNSGYQPNPDLRRV
jgi:hypothetical protein